MSSRDRGFLLPLVAVVCVLLSVLVLSAEKWVQHCLNVSHLVKVFSGVVS